MTESELSAVGCLTVWHCIHNKSKIRACLVVKFEQQVDYLLLISLRVTVDLVFALHINPLTPMILLKTLPTICHAILMMLVWRICYWIKQ